jgi:hypothetical protein
MPFSALQKAIYRVLKVTKCRKISQIVLSTRVTEIISIDFVVYWPLLKSGRGAKRFRSPKLKKVGGGRGAPLPDAPEYYQATGYARYVWRFFHPSLKYILWIPILDLGPTFPFVPTIFSNHLFQSTKLDCTSEGPLTVKETCPRHQLEIQHKKKDKLGGNIKSIISS